VHNSKSQFGGRSSHRYVTQLIADSSLLDNGCFMASGFNIYRKLENGENLYISWRGDLHQAEELARKLNECWPGEYAFQEASSAPITGLTPPPRNYQRPN
jgi:hypothetical protein